MSDIKFFIYYLVVAVLANNFMEFVASMTQPGIIDSNFTSLAIMMFVDYKILMAMRKYQSMLLEKGKEDGDS